MEKVILLPHQQSALDKTKDFEKVAYYFDMGLGKTYIGSEKLIQLANPQNLLVCQKSKVKDWVEHFKRHYNLEVLDFTVKKNRIIKPNSLIVINYDLVWRLPELLNLSDFTLMLDESSYIKNESSKRTKFIMKLKPKGVILLSGTPVGGKYEELISQCKLLGWNISKKKFYENYIISREIKLNGFRLQMIQGYKNVNHLKRQLGRYGAIFSKSEDVLTLPEQVHSIVEVDSTKEYKTFKKDRVISIGDIELVGDTSLTYLLYLRQLCGIYNKNKFQTLSDILQGTSKRVIIFYNFKDEFEEIKKLCEKLGKPLSAVNGTLTDLKNYEDSEDSVTLIQYQSGSMGLNLQKSNTCIYWSLPLSSDLFEQSKKRIHRIGQSDTCFYYYLMVKDSIEFKIYQTLKNRQDYTLALFE